MKFTGLIAVIVAMTASAGLVWEASYSAFSSTTSNSGNSWATGTVSLANDSSSTAMFAATNLKPGSTGTHCIAVTSSGTLASSVKLYGTTPTTTNALSTYITLTITQGTGGGFANCTGFTADATNSAVYSGTLASFATTYTNFSSGAGIWGPTGSGSETKVYQFTYAVSASIPTSASGSSAGIGFTWEDQNT